LKKTELN